MREGERRGHEHEASEGDIPIHPSYENVTFTTILRYGTEVEYFCRLCYY